MKRGSIKLVMALCIMCIMVSSMFQGVWADTTNQGNLNAAIKDSAKWKVYNPDEDKIMEDDGDLTLTAGIGAYPEGDLYNKLVEFKMTTDATVKDAWPTISVRDQLGADKPQWEGGSAYTVTFKSETVAKNTGGKIEVNAYKAGQWASLGEIVPSQYFWGSDANTTHDVKFGAVNEGDAVRIILIIDGKELYNKLDTTDPIKNSGFITVYAWAAPVTLGSIEVAKPVDLKSEVYKGNLNATIKDSAKWKVYNPDEDKIMEDDGDLTLTAGIGAYPEGDLYNKLVEFKMTTDASVKDAWPTISVRDQLGADKPQWEGGSAYTVTFKSETVAKNTGGKIEINAYKAGQWVSLGEVVPSQYFWGTDANTTHDIKFGALDEGSAVRIVLYVDGKELFNKLDTTDPIKTPGFITVYAWAAPVTIGSVEEPKVEEPATDTSVDTASTAATDNPKTGDVGVIPFATAAAMGLAGLIAARKKRKQ